MEEVEEETAQASLTRARHIKKRALKNKALSVSFNEKDLRDFVGGFHKRKKKRRKEAQHKIQEAQRRKRIEARKKRKMERDYVMYGEAPPATDSGSDRDEGDEDDEEDEGNKSISGTTTYDSGDVQVTVTTSEISREEDQSPIGKPLAATTRLTGGSEKKHNIPVSKKKPFKKVSKQKSRRKLRKGDKKKGKQKKDKSKH